MDFFTFASQNARTEFPMSTVLTAKPLPRCSRHKDSAELPRLCHVCQRIAVEHDITERAIKALFAAKFAIAVNNGEDDKSELFAYDAHRGMQPCANAVLDAMFATDDEYLQVENSETRGWIRFVYGNDGYDVISDYSVNLEDVLKPVNAYADTLDAR